MISFSKYNSLFWDFDGVLMDSMPIREAGFRKVLQEFPASEVSLLIDFHRCNGGLSRYVKFRYFFEKIRNEVIHDDQVIDLAGRFSAVMMESLLDPKLLIDDSIEFVKRNHDKIPMHIVSGSDGEELRQICKHIGLNSYFKSIHGSPTTKKDLVSRLMEQHKYENVLLIGDSLNDFEAAQCNSIDFAGFNNVALKNVGSFYIESFAELDLMTKQNG